MARIVFVVAMLAVTIYAAADWHRTPEDEMPGKIAKPIWLMIILFTATIAAIGPIAWLVLRWVSRAETKQTRAPEAPKRPSAPDDDPEFLFRLERDIQRKRREDERRAQEQRKHSEEEGTGPAEDSGDEANCATLTPSAAGTSLLRRDAVAVRREAPRPTRSAPTSSVSGAGPPASPPASCPLPSQPGQPRAPRRTCPQASHPRK